ncbi:M56 family metallopeptidase [Kitasatospora sp. NPDC088346]|uniref:M56 family metallopeptidase n=1 Tax=Kitasatospora sp. NPDC088346 TaxID=3364073 RepID=UPI003823133D
MPVPVAARRPRIDERVLGAGTSIRFVTLLILVLAVSGAMALEVIRGLAAGDTDGCDLAAGVDPDDGGFWAKTLSITGQATAYRFCFSRWAPAPPWWQVFGWPVLLTAVAGLIFGVLPRWKARRGRVVALELIDAKGELLALLGELGAVTGVVPLPRVVVDPAAASVGAVVFGRTRRPVVCLHGGLLAIRRSDPERFRAVLLHEFAHIANRDVTLTYVTVALWRAFLALVLLPYVLWQGYVVYGLAADGVVPQLDRAMVFAVVMVVLVYLARSDTLRSREIYADLAAVRWGADPHGWSVSATPPAGRVRGALASFLELWRTHPRWGLRQGALADPAPLFRASALPLFLIGAVPVIAVAEMLRQVAPYRINFTNNLMVVSVLIPAALVTGVIGVALWRAMVYAVLTGSRVPAGARAGGWLGAGISAGMVFSGYGTGWAWLPQRPQVLLVPVLAGATLGWWITQCAHLSTRTWRGRSLRPALALCLAAGFIPVVSWLTWWMLAGSPYAGGLKADSEATAGAIVTWLPSAAPARDLSRIPGIATAQWLMDGVSGTPLCALAVTTLWVAPLLVWSAGPVVGNPRWMPATAPPSGDPVAPLGRVLLPGLLGGAVACLAVVGVQAYLHLGQPVPDARGGLYAWRYLVLLILAPALPSVVAAAVASTADRRFRLLGALIAAQTATLMGLAATTVLVSVDGCIAPLSVLDDSCAWRPAWWRPLFPLTFVLHNALVLAALAATAAALATSAVRRWAPRSRAGRAPAAGPGSTRGRRVAVGLLCASVLAATSANGAFQAYQAGFSVDMIATQRALVQRFGLPDPQVSDETSMRQLRAWYRLSGDALIDLAARYDQQLTSVLRQAQAVAPNDTWDAMDRRLRPVCTRWRDATLFETVWFRVPADTLLRADWHAVGTWADRGSRRCTEALDARDLSALRTALQELRSAGRCAESVNAELDGFLRIGGRPGTSRPPAKGAAAVCDKP